MNTPRALLVSLSLLLLLGCTCPGISTVTIYQENLTRVNALETALNSSNAALVEAQGSLTNATVALGLCQTSLQACNSSLSACLNQAPKPNNCTIANCTPCATNLTKYSFTCADEYSGYYFQTAYRCFWDVREHYHTGFYTNMAEMCFSLGLPDACSCYWGIAEYTGIRASTGAYPGSG